MKLFKTVRGAIIPGLLKNMSKTDADRKMTGLNN
jgi:hypothetical protein